MCSGLKKAIFLIFIFLILLILIGCEQEKATEKEKEGFVMEKNTALTNITIINIYDNVEFDPGFKTGFGFGCIIKLENKTILFDTGGDSPTLLDNLEKAGIGPEDISIAVISHVHDDLTGGLSGFLEKNSNVKVFLPSSFPSSLKNEIMSKGTKITEVADSIRITEGVYSTGELGTWIKEQSLIIDTEKGLIVVTGCAHPGIVDIVKKSKELMKKHVYLVMGGFHQPPLSTVKDFRELEVEKAAPSHCTGNKAVDAFRDEYKNDFIKSGVGKMILI